MGGINMLIKIENIADGIAKLTREVSYDEYVFLKKIAEELNNNDDNDDWCPTLYIDVLEQ